jgi:hypothetical protein
MKLFKASLLMSALLLCGMANGHADRLYTWTDAKGVTHITQDPPPDTAKAVDTIDYEPLPNQPVRRSTMNDQIGQRKANLDKGDGQSRSDSGSGFTSGDDEKDIQYEGESYRRTLLRYEIEHKLLDDNEQVKGGDFPVRVQSRSGRR